MTAAATETTETRSLAYGAAFTESLREIMRDDPSVFVAGEDVGASGGVFGFFRGLHDEFGSRRVVDTPISEQAIVGLGIGAAVSGLRPVVDLMFMDFTLVAMDQIANQAAKLKYMFGGNTSLPLTITTAAGAGLSAAAQHSQSLEAMLCHVPGLKVVMPSSAHDVKGLLRASILDDNPVVFVMHKGLLGAKGPCPEASFETPLGRAVVLRPGDDVTVVTYGAMVGESLEAAEMVGREGISVAVIDLRSLQPLDTAAVVESVKRTNRCVVVHEAVEFAGLGAEIAAQVQEHAFDYLDAPIIRVAAPFAPVPFAPVLEAAYVPNAEHIADRIRATIA